jgi:L-alanine-DL-glutamate epimerase-like enolase superfamily enzyme
MSPTITDVDVAAYPIDLATAFPVTYEEHTQTEHVFVRLRTDNGLTAYGEGTALPWFTGECTETMAATVERWFAPRLVGTELEAACTAFEEARREYPGNPGAKAAVDLALWDLRGKAAGVPVSTLLGPRRREEVPVVTTIPGLTAEEASALARERAEAGFSRFKVKATGDVDADVERIDAVLSAIPSDATLRIDPNTSWQNHPTAKAAIERLDTVEGIEYLEQPVAPERLDDLAAIWAETGIPVYADEAIHGPEDVERIGSDQLAAGCHFKLAKSGSLGDQAEMANAAARHDLAVTVVSAFGTSLDVAANLHLSTVVPTLSSGCEFGATYLVEDPADPQLGREPVMRPPDGPGLGVALDDAVFEQSST